MIKNPCFFVPIPYQPDRVGERQFPFEKNRNAMPQTFFFCFFPVPLAEDHLTWATRFSTPPYTFYHFAASLSIISSGIIFPVDERLPRPSWHDIISRVKRTHKNDSSSHQPGDCQCHPW
ncbi:uncharacterized protein PV06_03376 [Exophiala oligosperma]|uniref:Uncharacterized protein n=1 Tax=Exophiala oligosperma TaxID=215243 RepID=A0A0D2EAF4_9EURO|nr:uncharacterized protein PV06_03376 [Exophiala oligosperma]KIW44944.1 hypothetical protein PV06_03376 [Exophiala oligosperma]